MKRRAWFLSTTAVSTVLLSASAALADGSDRFAVAHGLPAVSGVNGKLAAFGGVVADDVAAYGVAGALAVPLDHSFGAQLDGMVGSADDAAFYGVAGHVFWRDPSQGLVGGYASWVGWDSTDTISVSSPSGGIADVTGADVGKLGLEAEAYLDRFSLEGQLAWQFGTVSGITGGATAAFYPTDDVRLEVGGRYLQGVGAIAVAGAEWAPSENGFSLFADGSVDDSDDAQVFGGVKLYFSESDKSLIRRHREDDPDVVLPDDLFTTTGDGHCPPGSGFDGLYCVF